MRPKYLQSLIILIILLLSFVVICVMLLHNIKSWIGWVFIIFFVLFLLIFFIDSFFEIFKGQTLDQINKYKNRLDYFDENLIIDYPYLQIKEKIKWNTIEAIFLSNKPPGDGEYHNFEYSIILNSEPKEVKYETQNWFNKINIFPRIKKKDYQS